MFEELGTVFSAASTFLVAVEFDEELFIGVPPGVDAVDEVATVTGGLPTRLMRY